MLAAASLGVPRGHHHVLRETEKPTVAVLYSGRWLGASDSQAAVDHQIENLLKPLEAAGMEVRVCWAATASQWCSDNKTWSMSDGAPSQEADAAIQ